LLSFVVLTNKAGLLVLRKLQKITLDIISISNEQIERANELYPFNALKGSITKGKSNIYGALGEILIYDLCIEKGLNVDDKSTYDYDLIIEGYTVDVKTKRTTVIPKPHYLCSISSFNTKQKCDFYFFVRINENMKEAYLLGYKAKEKFFNESKFAKKGSLDINGWAFKDDGYHLEVSKLNQFNHLLA